MYGPLTEGYIVATCRDACDGYPYFAMRNGEWCGCSYGYGEPEEEYPEAINKECDLKGVRLGGVEVNAVYSNDLNENENC
jgi:hypothetical protein